MSKQDYYNLMSDLTNMNVISIKRCGLAACKANDSRRGCNVCKSRRFRKRFWAIFPGKGTGKSIQELEERIVTEWLPTSGYEFTQGPDVEVYFDPDPNNTQYEVWIPIKKV